MKIKIISNFDDTGCIVFREEYDRDGKLWFAVKILTSGLHELDPFEIIGVDDI